MNSKSELINAISAITMMVFMCLGALGVQNIMIRSFCKSNRMITKAFPGKACSRAK
jgi:hypothetical protein